MSQEILEDHLRKIFNLCDDDLDGVISIKDLSKREEIQEFGEQMSELLAKLDPFGTGQVSFNAFVEGIQSFLSVNDLPAKVDQTLEENGLDRGDQAVLNELNLSEDLPSKASHTQIHIGDLESSSECSEDNEERAHVVEVVAPLNSHIARKLSKMGVSTGTDSSEDQELMTKEFEARLQCLEQENQLLVSRQQNLLSENLKLKENLDVVEDELQEDRRSLENERKERDKEQLDWKRLRSETELEMGMLRMKVNSLHSENEQLKNNEIVLKSRSDLFREEINVKDEHLEGLKSKLENVEVMMRRKEEIWKKERALLKAENDEVLRDLQEISKQKESITLDVEQVTSQRHSTASVDVDFTREIFALNKEIDRLKAENSKLMVDLLQQGKILVSTKVQSLGAELETASRDQLMSTLREAEAYNERLRLYIDSLLANVMEKHPELLEVRGR